MREQSSGLVTTFFPKAPDALIEGIVTKNLSGGMKISRFDTVIINKGLRENLRQGDMFAVYRQSNTLFDSIANEEVTLPAERVGLVMIYRPFEKMSYGIVLTAKEDIEVGYILKSPQL